MSDDRGSNLSSLKRRLAALFAITAAAVIAGGVAYNNSYRASLIRDSEKLLTSIEDFKIQQITYWRKDRLDDTMSLLDSPLLSIYLNELAVNPSNAAARSLLSKRLQTYIRNNRYTEALLTRLDGKVLVSTGKRSNKACPEAGAILAKADASGRPVMGDFNVFPGETKPHIDLVARAAKGPAGKNLFLLLRIDPQDYIYPLIVKWPTNSRTGETLLVTRAGNKIVYLNEIRHLAGAAMKLQLPADAPHLPAAIAFTGKPGIVRGRDYRGVEVLASVSTIPGTNWAIVTKMDMAEVLAGSGRVSLLLLLLGLSLLGTAGAGAYLVFRRQAEEYRRSYAELDRQTSALKDNYARLNAQANDAIIIADAQTLRIIETNRKSHEMYGYTEEEFSRLKISDLVPESGLARQQERLKAVRSGPGAVIGAEHKRKNGELFHAEVSASCTSGSGKEYIFAIVRDLSERMRMQQTLRDSEENYRQLFEAESDAILLIDNENGELKQANNAASVLYGYTHEELLAMRNTDLSAEPEDTSKVTRTTPLDAGKVVVIPLRYHRKKNGEVFPVEITGRFFTRNGRPVHIVAIRDITGRKKAEEKLRLGEERLRMAAEAAQFGVYDYDIESGVRSYSPEFLGLFGLPPGAALPLDADQAPVALYPEDKDGFLAARRAGYDPLGTGLVEHEFRIILPTGLLRWLRVRGRTVFTGTGAGARPLRANGVIQDITARKLAEEALRASESAVRNKLNAIMAPEGDIGTLELTDIFDIHALQGMMDELYKLTKITSAILDMDGKVVVASGWQDICTRFHRVNAETCRHCLESDTILTKDVAPGTSKSYFCKNNLRDIATPLMVGGRHVGNFFLGQFLYEDDPRDYDTFREQARRYGFNEKEYLAAYDRIPVFTREKVEVLITFYRQVTELISALSYGRIKLARALAQSRLAEDRLRESQEIFNQFMEHSPSYVFFKDENIRALRLSRNYETMLGKPMAELLGKNMDELFPSDLAKSMVADDLRILKEGKEADIIEEMNGRIYRTIKFPISIEGKPRYLAGYTLDITAQKQAEEKIARMNERIGLAARAAHLGIWDWDIPADKLVWDDRMFELYGVKKEAFDSTYEAWTKRTHPDDRARCQAAAEQALRGEAKYDTEFRVIHPDGTTRYLKAEAEVFLDPAGKPIRMVGVNFDITERKLAEEVLRKSEEEYRAIFEESFDGLFTTSPDGRILDMNKKGISMFGYASKEEVRALDLAKDVYASPPDRARIVALVNRLGTAEYEVWVKKKNGGTMLTHCALTGVKDADGGITSYRGIIRDITESKRIENSLRKSEKDLKEAQRLARIGSWEWDAGSDTISWSPEYYHIYGLDPSQPPPGYEEHLKAYTAESAARLDAAVKKSMQSGEPYELDLELAVGKGETRWVTARSETLYGPDGKVTGLRGTAQDITGRQLAERELRETEERLRSLMNSMPDIVCFKDGEGRWLEANTFDLKLFQLEGVEYKGKKDSELAPFSQFYHDAFMTCEASDEKAWQNSGSTRGEEVIPRPDGSAYTFDIIKVPLFTPEGKRKALTVVGRDITERKRAELKLKKLNQDLIDKKQEMENFLYITTHDLRSPLVNIQGFSQNLEHYLLELKENLGAASLPPEPKEALEKLTGDRIPTALKFILESSRKMDALITALLKVSRLGRVEMKPETVDMNGLVDKVAESMHYQLEQAGGEVKHGDLPRCKADPGAVSQLFANLLDNAIKYRQEGRQLSVSVSAEVREGMVIYRVTDNGSGIPETDQGRIWDVFYRHGSSGEKSGEGIGLPMVKRIAEKNGGNITVTSKLGEGSVFCVSLPAA